MRQSLSFPLTKVCAYALVAGDDMNVIRADKEIKGGEYAENAPRQGKKQSRKQIVDILM